MWADFDGDTRPELLVLNYASPARLLARDDQRWYDVTWRLPPPPPLVLWSPGQPPPPALERSRSTWIHTAVTADFNADGSMDLLTLGRAGFCGLWLNDGSGQFYDLTSLSNLKPALFPHLPSHAAAGDVDGDGDLDLVLLYRPDPVVKPLRGPLELWRCVPGQAGLSYEHVVTATGLTGAHDPLMGMLADLDNDGHLDLYVVQSPRGDAPSNLLFQGNGAGGFQEVTAQWGGAGPAGGHAESAWPADLDGDGDLDLLTFHGGSEEEEDEDEKEDEEEEAGAEPSGSAEVVVCYENTSQRWQGLTIELVTSHGPGHGLGAQLVLEVAGRRQLRQVVSLANPLNSAILPVHFGVGDQAGPYRLIVLWPSGRQEQVTLPLPGVAYRIHEGHGKATVLTPGVSTAEMD
jgi:hypothetical protein